MKLADWAHWSLRVPALDLKAPLSKTWQPFQKSLFPSAKQMKAASGSAHAMLKFATTVKGPTKEHFLFLTEMVSNLTQGP